jgi:hypothetical protein
MDEVLPVSDGAAGKEAPVGSPEAVRVMLFQEGSVAVTVKRMLEPELTDWALGTERSGGAVTVSALHGPVAGPLLESPL